VARYRLIGSLTSPYVRRFRLYLAQGNVPYEFDGLKDMYGADDGRLSDINPLKRIPVLTIDGRPLWESRVIFNRLRADAGRAPLEIEEENAVSTVDALQDQLVQMFLMRKYGHPIEPENEYFRRHADRRRRMVDYLRAETIAGRFDSWDYPAMSLYCLLDWSAFRGMLTPAELEGPLTRLVERHQGQPQIAATDPRKA
jgi:glutathione S-transferase